MDHPGASGESEPPVPPGEVTELLLAHRAGDPKALDSLFALVYQELRRIARQQLVRERRSETLDTTGLVHEAYLRLVDQTRVDFADRNHFYGIAARAMRQILVDFARTRASLKRGEGRPTVSLDRVQIGFENQIEWLVTLDESLEQLAALSPRLVRVFEYRFFGGLSEKETAEALDIPLRTVQRDWRKSKLWLRGALGSV